MFLPEELEAPVLIIDTNLGPTWGFVLVMSFISVALWGITCAQVYFYYSNYPKDAAYVRFTVIWLWIFDTTREVLVIIAVAVFVYLGGSNPFILIILFPFILFGLAGTCAYVALLLPNPTVQNLEAPLMQCYKSTSGYHNLMFSHLVPSSQTRRKCVRTE
ncbi:hypothetical protein SERLA73DRAFT_158002 [Serpula lacrymans var. lacrymans S7.3]|uniref:Uncharacterized protein n=1 Tax=Serpula lacrymans var. lacrymans (strain S7.3) TaxID=936435 RepID=F8PJP2_SERL3|nr:hypothetical protein SERLA73DRAFT_158002 [Serpula lacrymans var. lacrymans S7.3]